MAAQRDFFKTKPGFRWLFSKRTQVLGMSLIPQPVETGQGDEGGPTAGSGSSEDAAPQRTETSPGTTQGHPPQKKRGDGDQVPASCGPGQRALGAEGREAAGTALGCGERGWELPGQPGGSGREPGCAPARRGAEP